MDSIRDSNSAGDGTCSSVRTRRDDSGSISISIPVSCADGPETERHCFFRAGLGSVAERTIIAFSSLKMG